MGTLRPHIAETRIEASGLALRSAGTKFLVHCKDALQAMYCRTIILIFSVSNNFVDGDN